MLTFLPAVLGITLALLTALRIGGRSDESSVFTYSTWIKSFSCLTVLLPVGVLTVFSHQGVRFEWSDPINIVAIPVQLGVLAAAMNVCTFKVRIYDDRLEINDFQHFEIRFDDIQSAEVRGGGQGMLFLLLVYANSKRYSISGYLQGFDQLVAVVQEKMAKTDATGHPNPWVEHRRNDL